MNDTANDKVPRVIDLRRSPESRAREECKGMLMALHSPGRDRSLSETLGNQLRSPDALCSRSHWATALAK